MLPRGGVNASGLGLLALGPAGHDGGAGLLAGAGFEGRLYLSAFAADFADIDGMRDVLAAVRAVHPRVRAAPQFLISSCISASVLGAGTKESQAFPKVCSWFSGRARNSLTILEQVQFCVRK